MLVSKTSKMFVHIKYDLSCNKKIEDKKKVQSRRLANKSGRKNSKIVSIIQRWALFLNAIFFSVLVKIFIDFYKSLISRHENKCSRAYSTLLTLAGICMQGHSWAVRGTRKGILTHQLWERRRLPVEQDGSFLHAGPQLEQAVQGQRGYMGFAPSLPTLLHFFFKLNPPRKMRLVRQSRTATFPEGSTKPCPRPDQQVHNVSSRAILIVNYSVINSVIFRNTERQDHSFS